MVPGIEGPMCGRYLVLRLSAQYYRAFQVACNWAMSCRSSHVIKLKLSSQLIGQFGHVTASASCKQPEKHGTDS